MPNPRRRRAMAKGGFVNPFSLPGLQVWLAADRLSLNDGDPISTWTDLSGIGNSPTAAGAARPTYKTNIINGHAVARFAPNQTMGVTYAAALAQPNTLFLVFSAIINTLQVMVDGTVTGHRNELFVENTNAIGYNAGTVQDGTDNHNGSPVLLSAVFNAGSSAFYKNGALISSANPGSNDMTGLSLGSAISGGGGFLNGDIAEFILYNRALSADERRKVERYLSTKYAITVT